MKTIRRLGLSFSIDFSCNLPTIVQQGTTPPVASPTRGSVGHKRELRDSLRFLRNAELCKRAAEPLQRTGEQRAALALALDGQVAGVTRLVEQ